MNVSFDSSETGKGRGAWALGEQVMRALAHLEQTADSTEPAWNLPYEISIHLELVEQLVRLLAFTPATWDARERRR